MNCNRNCLYQKNGLCNLKLSSSSAKDRCPLMTDWALPNVPYKMPMTNAEYIRSMSDEELAEWMGACNAYRENADAEQWLPWLREPAGGEQHEVQKLDAKGFGRVGGTSPVKPAYGLPQ